MVGEAAGAAAAGIASAAVPHVPDPRRPEARGDGYREQADPPEPGCTNAEPLTHGLTHERAYRTGPARRSYAAAMANGTTNERTIRTLREAIGTSREKLAGEVGVSLGWPAS